MHLKLFDGQTVRIFITFGMYLADADELRAAYGFKGHAGLKVCALCTNVFNKRLAEARGISPADGVSVLDSCCKPDKFDLLTPDKMMAVVRRLDAAAHDFSKGDMEELEVRLGWNYLPGGLMFDAEMARVVEPSQHLLFDWVHIYFVNGVFNAHAGLLLRDLHLSRDIKYQDVLEFVKMWSWPNAVNSLTGKNAMDGGRWRTMLEKGSFTCSASEGLSLLPVLSRFAYSVLLQRRDPAVRQLAASFLLLHEVVRQLDRCSREDVRPETLSHAITAHAESFCRLFGEGAMVPKFHFAMHLPRFVHKWRYLPNTLVLERKHRLPKRYADPAKNPDNSHSRNASSPTSCVWRCIPVRPQGARQRVRGGVGRGRRAFSGTCPIGPK